MTQEHPITPPPPHLLKKFSAEAQAEAKKRNGAGYLKTFATLCIKWALDFHPTPNDRQIRSSEITPPPELVEKWYEAIDNSSTSWKQELTTQAARWGADQELEECIKLLSDLGGDGEMIRRYRRPKPPTPTKEEALDELFLSFDRGYLRKEAADIIRRALESLPE